jgi:hypothetical protein
LLIRLHEPSRVSQKTPKRAPLRPGKASQSQAERDPTGSGNDEVDAEEYAEDIEAGDGPVRQDHQADQKGDDA